MATLKSDRRPRAGRRGILNVLLSFIISQKPAGDT